MSCCKNVDRHTLSNLLQPGAVRLKRSAERERRASAAEWRWSRAASLSALTGPLQWLFHFQRLDGRRQVPPPTDSMMTNDSTDPAFLPIRLNLQVTLSIF